MESNRILNDDDDCEKNNNDDDDNDNNNNNNRNKYWVTFLYISVDPHHKYHECGRSRTLPCL
jgi:hypothetical protein